MEKAKLSDESLPGVWIKMGWDEWVKHRGLLEIGTTLYNIVIVYTSH